MHGNPNLNIASLPLTNDSQQGYNNQHTARCHDGKDTLRELLPTCARGEVLALQLAVLSQEGMQLQFWQMQMRETGQMQQTCSSKYRPRTKVCADPGR